MLLIYVYNRDVRLLTTRMTVFTTASVKQYRYTVVTLNAVRILIHINILFTVRYVIKIIPVPVGVGKTRYCNFLFVPHTYAQKYERTGLPCLLSKERLPALRVCLSSCCIALFIDQFINSFVFI